MIHFFAMAQLMDYHIIRYIFGNHAQQKIKGKISFCAAAAPAAGHGPDGNSAIGNADSWRKVGSSFFHKASGMPMQKKYT